jgi:deoxycytidine triphosphate deaminase
MILSDRDLKDRIIQDPKEAEQAKQWWEKGEWDKIGSKILIDPFKNHRVGLCSYDLSVGEEYVSLRDPDSTNPLKEGEHITVGPGETVLILTEEYICLPQNTTAIVIPRATWIFEGTSVCASRIEPTWYGKLLIAFTNLAKNPVALDRGEEFCTCYFMETSQTEKQLTRDKVHFLGRTKIGSIKLMHVRRQMPLEPDEVREHHMKKVVDLYGWPWDIVRGMFVLTLKEITEYVEKEVAPAIVEDATSAAIARAFENQQKWIRNLIIGLLTIGAGLVGLVGYLVYLVLSRP